MKNSALLFLFVFMGIIHPSCKKHEGPGGRHTIKGKVLVRNYDATFTTLESQYYAENENVYIIYGDDPTYGDSQKTNFDGTYEFKYFHKGRYTIYAYSKDSTFASPSGNVASQRQVVIGSDKITTMPDLVILK
jgi:hypothetical protein